MIEITDITDIKRFNLKHNGCRFIVTYYRHDGWFNYKMFVGDDFIKDFSRDTISEQSILTLIYLEVKNYEKSKEN